MTSESLIRHLRNLVDEYRQLVEAHEAELTAVHAENVRLKALLFDEIKAIAVMAKRESTTIMEQPDVKAAPLAMVPHQKAKRTYKPRKLLVSPITRTCRSVNGNGCGAPFSTLRPMKTLCDQCDREVHSRTVARLHAAMEAKRQGVAS